MSQDLDRIKGDVEAIQMAMGLTPSVSREWIEWMKRDRWFGLWWCLPGIILILSALLPFDHSVRYLGLLADQWTGLLVAVSLMGLAIAHSRKVNASDGRPQSLIREARRINGFTAEGAWFGLASLVQIGFYFLWGHLYHIPFEPFWAGLFILLGSTYLIAALVARAWVLLGYALPFLAYGLSLPLVEGHSKLATILFGMMFVGVALSFSIIQACQIHFLKRHHDSH